MHFLNIGDRATSREIERVDEREGGRARKGGIEIVRMKKRVSEIERD